MILQNFIQKKEDFLTIIDIYNESIDHSFE